MIFKGKVKNGRLVLMYRQEFREHLLELEGKEIVLMTEKFDENKRSKYQNNYYWAILRRIAKRLNELGYDTNAQKTHEWFTSTLLYEYRLVPSSLVNRLTDASDSMDGHEIDTKIVRSTTSLSKEEFAEYLDTIIRYCAEELDMIIPTADEWFD